jgi:hypothetical protein
LEAEAAERALLQAEEPWSLEKVKLKGMVVMRAWAVEVEEKMAGLWT